MRLDDSAALFALTSFAFLPLLQCALIINFDNNVYGAQKWWRNPIDYAFAPSMLPNETAAVREALDELEGVSCLKFVENLQINVFTPNAIVFVRSRRNGCRATVGRQRYNYVIGFWLCFSTPGFILHEVLHTLGFAHEHQRADRDDFIDVFYPNVVDRQREWFSKVDSDHYNTLGTPYDMYSLMHYGPYIMSKTGWVTMWPKDQTADINRFGQRQTLSQGDIWTVNRIYC